MDLDRIIDFRDNQPPIWVGYPGSQTFAVSLCPLAGRNDEWLEASREIGWDAVKMERTIRTDRDKYFALFGHGVIKDWRGLDVATLRQLVLIKNIREVKKYKGEIACSPASRLLLLKHSDNFTAWVRHTVSNVELFNAEREKLDLGN